jgi:hypothetical protein
MITGVCILVSALLLKTGNGRRVEVPDLTSLLLYALQQFATPTNRTVTPQLPNHRKLFHSKSLPD